MSDIKRDGGPAFPSGQLVSDDSYKGWTKHEAVNQGMSLRDWLAGQALAGMIAGSQGLDISIEKFASQSYNLADAMLKERLK